MSRSASASSVCVVPGWGTQVPPPQAGEKAAVAIVVGPVSVELEELVQSTWNFQRWRPSLPASSNATE
jgi:hypothetical protein